jgi:hypothetical protein
MRRSLLRMTLFLACAALVLGGLSRVGHAAPNWAPSHRYGPTVKGVFQDAWDGYDSYSGSFWMYQGMRWTAHERQEFQNDERLKSGNYGGVYEFRRVGGPGEDIDLPPSKGYLEGDAANEHWDGVWGRNTCAWFVICLGNFIQDISAEFITSLPDADIAGAEEFDKWFSSINGLLSIFPPFPAPPPSFSFDLCTLSERFGGGNHACDEEYEVGFDPYAVVANKFYHIAIRFRVDRNDGMEPTKWVTKYEIEYPRHSFGYTNYYPCQVDEGVWQIDPAAPGGHVVRSQRALGTCVDSDGDGIVDGEDKCPNAYDPLGPDGKEPDKDGDGIPDACDGNPAVHQDDLDADGVVDGDNCPQVANPDQADFDGDGAGDLCDDDDDNDGVLDLLDAFPHNPDEWVDTDGDGVGNNADADDDGDCYSDEVEAALGSNPLNKYSTPPDLDGDCIPDSMDDDIDGDGILNAVDPTPLGDLADRDGDGVPDGRDPCPLDPAEWSDNDGDKICDNADTDDDNDCFLDEVEVAEGSDPRDPNSIPVNHDNDCIPDSVDVDDDNDGVADAEDPFPLDPAEWLDTDGDGVGNNADADDDGDGMPDWWEIKYQLNPLARYDADADSDQDGYANFIEYRNGTDPRDGCSPPKISFCYNFWGDPGQCGDDATRGEHCVPLDAWSLQVRIETDHGDGGCFEQFKLKSACPIDLQFCVDFRGSDGGDQFGQCGGAGTHCAALNTWTDTIGLDMDARDGWCVETFSVTGTEKVTFDLEFSANNGLDSDGQCQYVGTWSSQSEYESATVPIGLDTDDRIGGCLQRYRLRRGTW